jgi:DNA polymerase III subunit delta
VAGATPIVYLYFGDDEPAMREAVATLQSELGDPVTAEMNTSRFEGQNYSFDDVNSVARAVPFLAARRLVVARAASKVFAGAEPRSAFTQLLDDLSPSTAMILLEEVDTADKKWNDKWEKNWLMKWVKSAGDRATVKSFPLPQGGQMAAWLRERGATKGGEINPQAATELAKLVGSDKQAGDLEIEKLLAYVAYGRTIEIDDVKNVSQRFSDQGDFFGLIDAVSSGNGERAMNELQKLMQERDLILLYFSLVGHFRALLQSRELVDIGQGAQIANQLGMHPYRAEKLAAQSRRFPMGTLEAIYRRLLDLDEQVKTGDLEPELAMEMLVASLSAQAV